MSENSDYSFLTSDMVLNDNIVPSKYSKQDVRLVYSKANPSHLGWWLSNTFGHERVALKDLIEYYGGNSIPDSPANKAAAEQIKTLPIAYYIE